MSYRDNGYPQSNDPYFNRDIIGGSSRHKPTVLSIIMAIVIGVVIGLVLLYSRDKLPFSISIIWSAIIGPALGFVFQYIMPLFALGGKVIPKLLRELRDVSIFMLAVISGIAVLITLGAFLLVPTLFPNGISFLSPQPPSYLPTNGSLIQNQLEVSDKPQSPSMRFSCYFDDTGAYHASEKGPGYFAWCRTQQIDFRNVAVVADVKLEREDYAGLFVRAQDSDIPSMYYCFIFPDGTYHLDMSQGQHFYIKKSGVIPRFKQGQTNTIALLAKDSKISLYVNGISIDSIYDSTYQDGTVGIISGNNSDVVFSNVQIWAYS